MSDIDLNRVLIIPLLIVIICSSLSTISMAQQTPQDLSRYYDQVLFSEDFERGASNWVLTDTWHVVTEGNNSYLVGEYYGNEIKTNYIDWNPVPNVILPYKIDNFTLEADILLEGGNPMIGYRRYNQNTFPWNLGYSIGLHYYEYNPTGPRLNITITKENALVQPVNNSVEVPYSRGWHKIGITGRGNVIEIKLDGNLVMTFIDDQDPYLAGSITFFANHDSKISIDNLKILRGDDTTYSDGGNITYVTGALIAIVLALIVLGFSGFYYLRKRKSVKEPAGDQSKKMESSQKVIETIPDQLQATPPADMQKKSPKPEQRVVGHDVFISYSPMDKPIADAICAGLEAEGIKCWIAPRDVLPGAILQEAIIEAIDTSDIMVVVYSSSSNRSPFVVRELSRAVSKDVIIIPFRIEDVPLSNSMEYLIAVPHWLDALTPPLEKHIKELVRVVRVNLDIKHKNPGNVHGK